MTLTPAQLEEVQELLERDALAALPGVSETLAARGRPDLAEAMRRTVTLRDGTLGYRAFPRGDACWATAVATCVQCPLAEVPDAHIDACLAAGMDPEAIDRRMWRDFFAWLDRRGLEMVKHSSVKAARRRKRWVGVVERSGPGDFASHALVFCRGEVLYDNIPPGFRVAEYTVDDVDVGFSFTTKKGR